MDQLTKEYKALVRGCWRLFTQSQRAWSKAFAELGLSSTTFPVVELAVLRPGISQQEIADTLCVDKSCVSRAVKSLMENGFLQREKSADVTHGFCCFPTEKSLHAYERVIELERIHIHALFSDIDIRQLQDGNGFLDVLNARLKTQTKHGSPSGPEWLEGLRRCVCCSASGFVILSAACRPDQKILFHSDFHRTARHMDC